MSHNSGPSAPATPSSARVVTTQAQVAASVDVLVGAFFADPLWAWAFPDDDQRPEQHRQLWRLLVEGAARYPNVWLAPGDVATAVWIPPGGVDLSDEQAAELEPLIVDLLGDDAGPAIGAFEALDAAHPHAEPHFYLSLLGTDPRHRGQGHGLALLAENLQHIDEQHAPAYLESSNPANVPLYARFGFEALDHFDFGPGTPTVTTMWRPAR
jgi:GNAT superfamily N-acetyltransferase